MATAAPSSYWSGSPPRAGCSACGSSRTRKPPGLGDRIELAKSPWVHGFDGKGLGDPADAGWAVKKDGGTFDQFAGATVTPRAVVRAVHKALRYFDANRERLLAPEEAAGHE